MHPDTDRIGDWQYKGRIARMPFTGVTFSAVRTPDVNDLYQAGHGLLQNSDPVRRSFNGTTAGAPAGVPDGGLDWGTIRGSFMLNGMLYLAHSNGDFTRRTFDGTSYGPPITVNTHDQLVTLTAWLAKGDLTISAYRGIGGAATVTAHGSKLDESLAAEHTTPTVTATDPTSWVSSFWAGKTSSNLTWMTPASQLLRASTSGSGSGRIVAVAADSGAAVPPGSGSSTATATPEVVRVVMFATVIELE